MAMTPEEIADRKFLVGLRGYDRDEVRKFLITVADDYRAALEGSQTPAESAAPADARSEPEAVEAEAVEAEAEAAKPAAAAEPLPSVSDGQSSPEDWARLGEEVAAVLRTAHEQVAALKAKAEAEAAEHKQAVETAAAEHKQAVEAQAERTKAEAEMHAAELRTKAEAWAESRQTKADADLQEAKRALANSQNEALTLVADADKRAQRMLQATERKARARAEDVLSAARAELADLKRSQEQANQWLEAARTYVSQAIDTYQSAPKPDLSGPVEVSDESPDTPDNDTSDQASSPAT